MASGIVEFYYDEIKTWAAKIGSLGLTQELVSAAKEHNKKKMEEIVEKFKEANPEVWEELSEIYESGDIPKIFLDDKEYEELVEYDSTIINPLNLCIFFALSDNRLDETDIFENWLVFEEALRKDGHLELVDYIKNSTISNLDDILEAYLVVE